mgnify:FL=1
MFVYEEKEVDYPAKGAHLFLFSSFVNDWLQHSAFTGQTHYIFYYILVCNFLTILLVINILSFANVDYFPYLYKIY